MAAGSQKRGVALDELADITLGMLVATATLRIAALDMNLWEESNAQPTNVEAERVRAYMRKHLAADQSRLPGPVFDYVATAIAEVGRA